MSSESCWSRNEIPKLESVAERRRKISYTQGVFLTSHDRRRRLKWSRFPTRSRGFLTAWKQEHSQLSLSNNISEISCGELSKACARRQRCSRRTSGKDGERGEQLNIQAGASRCACSPGKGFQWRFHIFGRIQRFLETSAWKQLSASHDKPTVCHKATASTCLVNIL